MTAYECGRDPEHIPPEWTDVSVEGVVLHFVRDGRGVRCTSRTTCSGKRSVYVSKKAFGECLRIARGILHTSSPRQHVPPHWLDRWDRERDDD